MTRALVRRRPAPPQPHPPTNAVLAQLGDWVADEWRRVDYDEKAFPGIAMAALDLLRPAGSFEASALLEWACMSRSLPPQFDINSKFGQPPITVYTHPRFIVDVYFWLDGTTEIHQHGFSGAFHVLAGSSFLSEFEWRTSHRVTSHLLLGDLRMKNTEILTRGQSRPIVAGADYIHALFHLDYPSVSLVIRTVQERDVGVQYSYKKPHLAIDPTYEEAQWRRIRQIIDLLELTGRDDALLLKLLRQADTSLAYVVLGTLAQKRQPEELEPFFAAAEESRPNLHLLKSVIHEEARTNTIHRLRRQVTDPEQRFFLALVLNTDSRDTVFRLMKERFPNRSPVASVMRVITSLTKPDRAGRSALGFELDESALTVARLLLETRSEAELFERLKGIYGDEDVARETDNLRALAEVLRRSPVLGTVFAQEDKAERHSQIVPARADKPRRTSKAVKAVNAQR